MKLSTAPVVIILVASAAFFYFWQLGRADVITDESSLATRAVGMVDFDFGIEQPTPWQWVDQIPWWMHLSFHDHPPLVFLAQHFSMRLFGETPFAIRLPSAVAGIAAVLLLYLIGKRLYSPAVGTFSSLLFAVTVGHVWISRLGLQESILIAMMLASVYCFLRPFTQPAYVSIGRPIDADKKKEGSGSTTVGWLAASAVFLGLAFLAKYLALILIPIFATIIFFRIRNFSTPGSISSSSPARIFNYDRIQRLQKWIIISAAIFIAVASPVVIYNVQLYRNFGHFDFQFSQLLGQQVKEWPSHPGQDSLGSYSNRIKNYIPWLTQSNSPYFLILAALGLIAVLAELVFRNRLKPDYASVIKNYLKNIVARSASKVRRGEAISKPQGNTHDCPGFAGTRNDGKDVFEMGSDHLPLVISLVWLLPFFVFVGPTFRFLTLLVPWLAIAAGFLFAKIYRRVRLKAVVAAVFTIIVIWEAIYSYNSVIALDPVGPKPWAYSNIHHETLSLGYNQLNEFFDKELAGKMPDVAVTFDFPFAHRIIEKAAKEGERQGLKPVPWGIVFFDGFNPSAELWVLLRRITYHGWPITDTENFINGGGMEFYHKLGVKKMYAINTLEGDLKNKGAKPREIKNPKGEVAFRVYEFELK